MGIHGSVTVSLPMKTYLWRIWSDIQLHSRNRARSGFTLKTRILLCVRCEQSFPKCDHLQREEFPSVFLIVLWIKPWSFLKKQNKNQKIQFLLYMLHISFFKNILCIHFFYCQLVSCSHDRLLVSFLHYATSMWLHMIKRIEILILPRIFSRNCSPIYPVNSVSMKQSQICVSI